MILSGQEMKCIQNTSQRTGRRVYCDLLRVEIRGSEENGPDHGVTSQYPYISVMRSNEIASRTHQVIMKTKKSKSILVLVLTLVSSIWSIKTGKIMNFTIVFRCLDFSNYGKGKFEKRIKPNIQRYANKGRMER